MAFAAGTTTRVGLSSGPLATIANFVNACTIYIPIHDHGSAPVGLNVLGCHDSNETLLAAATGLERACAISLAQGRFSHCAAAH